MLYKTIQALELKRILFASVDDDHRLTLRELGDLQPEHASRGLPDREMGRLLRQRSGRSG